MNFRFNFLSIILIGTAVMGCAQSKMEIVPQTYVAVKTSETIEIDGIAKEDAWKKAEWTNDFIDIEGDKTPTYQTRVKMLWDENYFYIFADIKEPHVWGTLKQRDTIIFYNNDFEIFIDPDGDTHNYYELEINALNTVWDLFLGKPYREINNAVLNDWNCTGLKSAVHVKGTLNNSKDTDEGWTMEMAIPFKALRMGFNQNNVPKDQFWRVNFSRVNWNFELNRGTYSRKKDHTGKFLPEYNWVWSPTGVINMHVPELWGYVYFSSKDIGQEDTFVIPNDEKVKWELYKLYRAQKAYYEIHDNWATSVDLIAKTPILIDGKTISPNLENYHLGWTISVKSPFSDKVLFIKEDGKFIEQ
ncbi:carbohydrate-binding family 9-like protein [Aestuariivivens sediminis]|uniref:carbohydrate-binding family 9-like protein n=1 Tax=Aestuariivivens sediminis TaxID=2913557 RepID=UPI001F592358|nr:carbohydrate-binding family 9-like protein [Aestuariivivens sediminis]